MLVFDLVEIARVVGGDVNVVVRQIELALDAEIHHEGRAGEFLARDFAVAPAAAQPVGNETLHGAGEIGVHHDRARLFHPSGGPDADRAPAFEEHFLDRRIDARSPRPTARRRAPSLRSPRRNRRSDERRRIRIQGMRESKTGSGSETATCRGISIGRKTRGGCAGRGRSG